VSDGANAAASAQALAPLVLVIDDDADALAICERSLRAAGYRTATAASGEAGLGLLAKMDAGLVVLDLAMPGLDGFAVAAEIRRRGTTAPILIFTGLPREQAARARAVGGTDVCSKPIEPQRFVAAVRRLCPLVAEEIR
jgi:DNA-binding response OmpR family regulator